ncbi:Guanylate kinase [Trachipleistophora hominis]|uniref:Guanylate kinase n=1 Tax=Trachipleistophora hominis TaxID=72359 RepID=L7JXG2_TRAHO|nr:Guanylate kinase [Trachipleistophora hominis]
MRPRTAPKSLYIFYIYHDCAKPMSKLVVVTGTSGCGKSTLIRRILNHENVSLSVSHTTREKRAGENNHIDYHFITKDEFMKMDRSNEFYETTFYDNHYYGTAKSELNKNEYVIIDCDRIGAAKFNEFNNVKIFFYNTKDVLYERLMKRYNNKEKAERRLQSYEIDMKTYREGNYKHSIFTDDLERNVKELETIIFGSNNI